MRSLIERLSGLLRRDSYLKGFSLLTGGTAVTQAVSLLLAPVLTRLYSPAEYGVNAVYVSLLTICGVVATLRLQVPIAMSHDEGERAALSRIGMASSVSVGALLVLIVALFRQQLGGLFGADARVFLWALPAGTVMLGAFQVLSQNLLSQKAYKSIARVGVLQVLSQGVAQVLLSFVGIGYMGLIAGNLIAYFVTVGYMLALLSSMEHWSGRLTRQDYFEVIRRHKDFPRYAFPAELLSIAGYAVIPIALTSLYGAVATGFYSLANRLIGVPLELFGNTLRQVYIREASIELHETGTVRRSFVRTTKILAGMAVPSAAALFILAPMFFSAVFGERWLDAGLYVRALTPLLLARFIVEPLITTVNVVRRPRAGMWIQGALLAGVLLVAYAHPASGDPVMFLVVLSTVYAAISFAVHLGLYIAVRKSIVAVATTTDHVATSSHSNRVNLESAADPRGGVSEDRS